MTRPSLDDLPDKSLTTPTKWPTKGNLEIVYPKDRKVLMLRYEEEEMEVIKWTVRAYLQSQDDPQESWDAEKEWNQMEYYVLQWQRRRFLRIYKGFIKGNLDLTGRHEQRWKDYMEGFEEYIRHFERLACVIEEVTTARKLRGMEFPETSYRIKPEGEEILTQWARRWDVDEDNCFSELHASLEAYNLWMKRKEPKFQTLQFLDLPQEIFEEIFDRCERKTLLALSRTCKALKGARIHSLKSYSLKFSDWEEAYTLELDYDSDLLPQILPYLQKCRHRFIDRLEDFLSRHDQCQLVKSLRFNFNWTFPGDPHDANDLHPLVEEPIFHRLFLQTSQLLSPARLPNISSLNLSSARLDGEFLAAICSFENLRTLTLIGGFVPPGETRDTLWSGTPPFKSMVTNLHLGFTKLGIDPESLWLVLCCCPNVRNLSLEYFWTHDELQFPDQALHSKFRCIEVLERLAIRRLDPDTVPALAAWLSERPSRTADGAPSGLTHFKISNEYLIPQECMVPLVPSLRSNHMQAITLSGLEFQMAQPRLIEDIAELCPNLISLRLIARTNILQRRTRAIIWPQPSWAYAPALAGFRSLKHFGWNFDFIQFDATPYPLVEFERTELGEEWEPTWEEEWFKDAETSVMPFAAHCPSLRTLSSNDPPLSYYEIIRGRGDGNRNGLKKSTVKKINSLYTRPDLTYDNPDFSGYLTQWPDL
ncbi:hypothetical protein CC1G_04658 [Coprinopsis cinerea okayama7|uniref:F-box domain-containing protein n=1 Tax=Coprinopsis cinerea (strain Okayama-7 / 130 / ATCC MYA-4618 / FGSC 9003) TaxID=240176 RepID=A8N551_COPC7|nr:hypothetical protein CC1G_04658 [Coprinopsis cinerea okayama7\|eukprot:XP_001829969.1 hypothetical protein CC1G_04658 [Coprinopsis cinerea okayama7\